MAKEGSVAPRERINIRYKPATEGDENVELPLTVLVAGDFTGRPDERELAERRPRSIDKDNFDEVLADHELELSLNVPDAMSREPDAEMPVTLRFAKLADFGPQAVLEQVPRLRELMELREALTALRSRLGNIPAFRKRIRALLDDERSAGKLLAELGIDDDEKARDEGEE